MNEKNDIYIIYSRKSKFTSKGESIENQIELCKKFLLNKYGPIDDDIVILQDEGFTGYNTNRPEFKKMINLIESKKVKCIIVYRLDRISRNVSDFCKLKDKFEKYHIAFISVSENFDTSSPMGEAMLMISSIFAQLERDTIAERIRDNMYELAKTGRWLGGTTPLGYKSKRIDKININGKRKSLYKLELIPKEVEIIKIIFEKMIEFKSITKLEKYLKEQEIKTKNNKYFSRFALTEILKNPVYVIVDQKIELFFESLGNKIYKNEKITNNNGLIAYNKRLEKYGKPKTFKDTKEWIISVGKHQGIIDSDTFIKTWKLIENNKNKRFRQATNSAILKGIIKCQCGSFRRPKLRNTYNINGQKNFSYLCELKDKSKRQLCNCQNIDGIELDKKVLECLKNIDIDNKSIAIELKKSTLFNSNNEVNNLNTLISENKKKISNLIDNLEIVDSDISIIIHDKIKKLKEENGNFKEKIEKITKEEKTNTYDLAKNILNNYFDIDKLDYKKIDLKDVIKEVIVSDEIVINFK